MAVLVYIIVMGSIVHFLLPLDNDLPSVRELQARQENEAYDEAGMREVNLFLAPYTTPDTEPRDRTTTRCQQCAEYVCWCDYV